MIYVRPISSVTNWSFRQILRRLQINGKIEAERSERGAFEVVLNNRLY
jgi:hypothetical protein